MILGVILFSIVTSPFCGAVFADGEAALSANQSSPKYIFLFIGDGMGGFQRIAAEQFVKGVPADSQFSRPDGLIINSLPVRGITGTNSVGNNLTDSAAAGTALACGVKTRNGWLGVDPFGKPVENLSTVAANNGKKVGIITSVMINHATPAAFFAHEPGRSHYNEIASQMPNSGVDFFAGGGLSWDGKKVPDEKMYQSLTDAGYTVAVGKEELDAIQPGQKALALYAKHGGAIPYLIDIVNGHAKKGVTLADFVTKGIELLDGPNGFFMMVEGGAIDWACHSNDASAFILETIDMDDAVKVAYDFYLKHPRETLIVITADHETGGLKQIDAATKPNASVLAGFTMRGGMLAQKLGQFKAEKASFDKVLTIVEEATGVSDFNEKELMILQTAWAISLDPSKKEKREWNYDTYDSAATAALHIMAKRAGLAWTTGGHSANPVPTTAIGVGSQNFAGQYENTEIAQKLKALIVLAGQNKTAGDENEKKDRQKVPALSK